MVENGRATADSVLERMADWSSLPRELVGSIGDNFSAIEDYTTFSAAVCRSYRFATKGDKWRPVEASREPPWLLLSCQDGNENDGGSTQRGFLSMYKDSKRFLMNLPELHGRHCWGTQYGWIVTLGLDKKFHLFNPLNRRRIGLPDLDPGPIFPDTADVRRHCIRKFSLIKRSPPPCSSSAADDFIVVKVLKVGMLKVLRANTWEEVKCIRGLGCVNEVICYQGQIYALCHRGRLLICSNFDDPTRPPTLELFVPNDKRIEGLSTEHYYIVESLGELVLVVRYLDEEYYADGSMAYCTSYFYAYKLNFETKKWVEIEDDLGDCALFVGDCQSMSLSQPQDFHCRSNCIYFTDDSYEKFSSAKDQKDMGIYDFGKDTIEPFYEGEDCISTYSTPTWFLPNLNLKL